MQKQNNLTRFATYFIGGLMLIAIGGGSFLSLLSNQTANVQPTAAPSATPEPFPSPIPTETVIDFSRSYLHPTGLFSVPVPNPPVWDSIEPQTDIATHRYTVTMRNELRVIESYVYIPGTPVTDLNAEFTEGALQQSWRLYENARPTSREMARRDEGDTLVVDFELIYQGRNFLARHIAWTDGTRIFVVRVVTPDNARDELLRLLDGVRAGFVSYNQTTPEDWTMFFDEQYRHSIRFPSTWRLTDSGRGVPASIEGAQGEVLRVEALPGTPVTDEAAARAWVEQSRPGAAILSVQPVTRGELSGFGVAYTFENLDGDPQSAYTILLNGDTVVHVATLRFNAANVDLNATTEPQYEELKTILNTFSLFTSLNIAPPPMTATPVVTPALIPPTVSP